MTRHRASLRLSHVFIATAVVFIGAALVVPDPRWWELIAGWTSLGAGVVAKGREGMWRL